MTQRIHIRVTMMPDGKTTRRELFVNGEMVTEISYVETLELAMNATSSLRYDGPMTRMCFTGEMRMPHVDFSVWHEPVRWLLLRLLLRVMGFVLEMRLRRFVWAVTG